MASIAGLSVLLVDDDADTRELLEVFLGEQGADTRAVATANEARAAIRERMPDVLLTDISLDEEDGFALLKSLRADPETRRLPAIAITGHSDAESRRIAREVGFQKVVIKPFDLFSLVAAIVSLDIKEPPLPTASDDARLSKYIEQRDMRLLLSTLNASTPYRYTSILRFEGRKLESVWTFDRANRTEDPFPSDMPIEASYCVFVEAADGPFFVTDANTDARVANHPKRKELAAYCGVPIRRADGSLFGTLCHYDQHPQQVADGLLPAMERVARMLTPAVSLAQPL